MSQKTFPIASPSDSALNELCARLKEFSSKKGAESDWPAESLRLCGEFGVFSWFIGKEFGGQGWNSEQITRGYLKLAAADLATTFIITQRTAATKRIEACPNHELKSRLLPGLANGELSSTVGISHLTTSRQHVGKPALRATEESQGFRIEGFSPWVTGSGQTDSIVMGATLFQGEQILFVVDTKEVEPDPPHDLMALTGSCTGAVQVRDVWVPKENVLDGPREQVLKSAAGAMTGGLQTSTLAIGLATAATDFIVKESEQRSELVPVADEFQAQVSQARDTLIDLSNGSGVCTAQELRTDANRLVTRATQAALVAAKGAGYVAGHPIGRWCREALFFLVWSCPQPVLAANLCELAGVEIE